MVRPCCFEEALLGPKLGLQREGEYVQTPPVSESGQDQYFQISVL